LGGDGAGPPRDRHLLTEAVVNRRASLSSRLPQELAPNRISQTLDQFRQDNVPCIDLTESNPTRVGLLYPESILRPLGDASALRYDPQPFGLRSARAAIARDAERRGVAVAADDVVLTASTSESYSWLFKLLCDPADTVLVPVPSYPLFEHLTRLESVQAVPYRLEYHGRWTIDVDSVRAAPASTRAIILVTPNNPTGSFVSRGEFDEIVRVCRDRSWAIIADEVFADYALEVECPFSDLATRADVLTFTLGGASKTLGLPQVKLGWMIAGGPLDERRDTLRALEHVADAFLSVNTPVQVAASSLLEAGATVRRAIQQRIRENLNQARVIARRYPSCDVPRVEGGWFASVRVPATRPEDTLVLDLLASEHVLVHPGYFFDFPHEAFVVVSLLPDPDVFADAFERSLRFMN
jgi:alanine-synthesizing transaminase